MSPPLEGLVGLAKWTNFQMIHFNFLLFYFIFSFPWCFHYLFFQPSTYSLLNLDHFNFFWNYRFFKHWRPQFIRNSLNLHCIFPLHSCLYLILVLQFFLISPHVSNFNKFEVNLIKNLDHLSYLCNLKNFLCSNFSS